MWQMGIVLTALALAGTAQSGPTMPSGLWQNADEGVVIRIEPCGAGFCGVVVDVLARPTHEKPDDRCGSVMLDRFEWNEGARRWQGRMHPPGSKRSVDGAAVLDGPRALTVTAKILFVQKKRAFVPYDGPLGQGCRAQ